MNLKGPSQSSLASTAARISSGAVPIRPVGAEVEIQYTSYAMVT
jgi:hypothetical protein